MSNFVIVGIGFVAGLSMAITGLITSIQQKKIRKIRAGMILNIIGILISAASLVMSLMNGFLLIH